MTEWLLLGNGLERDFKSSVCFDAALGEVLLEYASIGPALNPSDNSSEVGPGQIGLRPASAKDAIAVKNEAIPPCLG